jgi:hypothetical protein
MHARLAVILLSFGVVECGGEDHDLPPDWEGAQSLPVDQSGCTGEAFMTGAGKLVLMRDMGRLRATYVQAPFRCEQRLCAYRLDDGASGARVLVQPCDMSPSAVSRCSCLYSVGFDVAGVEPGRAVALHRRWDRYGVSTEPQPELVASERAP